MTRHTSSLRLATVLVCLGVVAVVGPGAIPDGEAPGRADPAGDTGSATTDGAGGSSAALTSFGGGSASVATAPGEDEAVLATSGTAPGFYGPPVSRHELAEMVDRLVTGGVPPAPLGQTRSARPDEYHDFYFTRAVYGGGGMGRRSFFGRGSWSVDYPKADRQFLVVLGETLDLLRVPSRENAVRLEDPDLRRFPFLYTLEVGGMRLTQPQVEGLRGYLRAGGFLVVDDFWGDWEWRNFEEQMRRVLPEVEFEELPLDHEIFHVFYDIDEILQVPNIGNAQRGVTSECGPCQPHVRGIFDEDGRLMAVINWNTDLGDAWEWSEQAVYPFQYSNFAYKMAVNFIVYAMTH